MAGLLLGLGMTLVVQSSSATIGVLQGVAQQAGPDGVHSLLGLAGATDKALRRILQHQRIHRQTVLWWDFPRWERNPTGAVPTRSP